MDRVPVELPAPPRPIRRRKGRGFFLGGVHLLLFPHCLIGACTFLGAVWMTGCLVLIGLLGTTVEGKITGKTVSKSKSTTVHRVYCGYSVGGQWYVTSTTVTVETYDSVEAESPVLVRVFTQAPDMSPQVALPGSSRWSDLGGIWAFTLFWNGVMSFFVWDAYLRPLLYRRLVRHGIATTGRIVDKKCQQGKNPSWMVSYHYQTPVVQTTDDAGALLVQPLEVAAVRRQGVMHVSPKAYEAIGVGDTVTVLYDPYRPNWSVVYEAADYEVVAP